MILLCHCRQVDSVLLRNSFSFHCFLQLRRSLQENPLVLINNVWQWRIKRNHQHPLLLEKVRSHSRRWLRSSWTNSSRNSRRRGRRAQRIHGWRPQRYLSGSHGRGSFFSSPDQVKWFSFRSLVNYTLLILIIVSSLLFTLMVFFFKIFAAAFGYFHSLWREFWELLCLSLGNERLFSEGNEVERRGDWHPTQDL